MGISAKKFLKKTTSNKGTLSPKILIQVPIKTKNKTDKDLKKNADIIYNPIYYIVVNLLIVNGYNKEGWNKLQKKGLQHICDFYRDQLLEINPKLKTTYIHPSIDLKQIYEEEFLKSFDGIVWTGSSLNIYDNTKQIQNQIMLMKILVKNKIKIFGSCWGMQVYTIANNGDVKKNNKGREIGISYNIALNKRGRSHNMYINKPYLFDAFCSHLDHITTLPKNSFSLAENNYSIQAISSKNFWGTQYHPEFNFKFTAQILNARKKILIKEKCFTKNQINSVIKAYNKPNEKQFSQSLLNDKIRKTELTNWLKFIRK
ncbi:MAG: hypothetical protein CMI90_04680 [Pelagibacteraceae bacterium]|nr:hypothetical protein [Pelagibacteraceae bacterium]